MIKIFLETYLDPYIWKDMTENLAIYAVCITPLVIGFLVIYIPCFIWDLVNMRKSK